MPSEAYPRGPDRRSASNVLFTVLTVLLVGVILRQARIVIIPLLIAGFLAYLMDPLVALLRRLRVPVLVAVAVTAVLYLCVFVVFGWIVYRSALEFAKAFPKYQSGFVELVRDLLLRLQNTFNTIIGQEPLEELEELQRLPVSTVLRTALRSGTAFVREFLLIFIFTLLFLAGKYSLARKILYAFPHQRAKKIALVLLHIDSDVRKYIGVKTLASLVVAAGSGVCLTLFGVEFAVVFAFLTFVLNFIPFVGSVAAVAMPALLSLIQFGRWGKVLWLVAILTVIQNLVAYVFEPRIATFRLKVSVPIIFLSLLLWGALWGAPGVLLAVPLTTTLKIIMEDTPSLRPIAKLLEPAPRRRR